MNTLSVTSRVNSSGSVSVSAARRRRWRQTLGHELMGRDVHRHRQAVTVVGVMPAAPMEAGLLHKPNAQSG